MGVPTLFRWLRDRYPKMLQQLINKPVINNFYIDMNGMIHPCFHPTDRPAPRNENEVFQEIFLYLDKILEITNPTDLLYLAIDGCAPRAKLNQQRLRRFTAAYESQTKNKFESAQFDDEEQPQNVPSCADDTVLEKLDSNQITPGTPFMQRLTNAIKQWIASRQSTTLKHLKIIFSDAQTPGEGEHKIMHYIRSQRQLPDYNGQTAHCIHGLDADLIMLALASHEPNFYIFREIVLLEKNDTSCRCCGQTIKQDSAHASLCPNVPDSSLQYPIVFGKSFHFMSISLFREYLLKDFECSQQDFERIIDDFVFLCFLSGNDFLPHIDCMRISDDALLRIIDMYKRLYCKGFFITNSGRVDFGVLLPFLQKFAQIEKSILVLSERRQNQFQQRIKLQNIQNWQQKLDNANQKEFEVLQKEMQLAQALQPIDIQVKKRNLYYEQIQIDQSDRKTLAIQYINEPFSINDRDFRQKYYKNRTPIEIAQMCHEFLRGMSWVSQYYCREIADWAYYYPYHDAPLIADLTRYLENNYTQVKLIESSFNRQSKPFFPYEQLLAVLPPHSCSALPDVLQKMMLDPESPLLSFYPNKFQIDVTGKSQLYQGTVLLPFIDEQKLRSAFSKVQSSLSQTELQRNQFSTEHIFYNCSVYEKQGQLIQQINENQRINQKGIELVQQNNKTQYVVKQNSILIPGNYRISTILFYQVNMKFNICFGNLETHFDNLSSLQQKPFVSLYPADMTNNVDMFNDFTNQTVTCKYFDILLDINFNNCKQLIQQQFAQIDKEEWNNQKQKRDSFTEKAFRDIHDENGGQYGGNRYQNQQQQNQYQNGQRPNQQNRQEFNQNTRPNNGYNQQNQQYNNQQGSNYSYQQNNPYRK